MLNRIPLALLVCGCLILITDVSAQGLEIDFSISRNFTKVDFVHSSYVDVSDNTDGFDHSGTQFNIGLTNNISNKFKFRTELGFISTNTIISISYKFDEFFGGGLQHQFIHSRLNNQKLYIGFLPEYRIEHEKISFYFQAGLLIATDVSNEFMSSNQLLIPKSNSAALQLGTGTIFGKGDISLKIDLGFTTFSKSKILNSFHPKMGYKNINAGIGIIYRIIKSTSQPTN